ncbi:MAG: hypothetical protein WBX11_18640, partial [Thiobacillaceae bacterium]
VEGRRQARKLLSKLNAQQRLEARRARAEQEEKTLQNQLQREAEAAHKADMLERAQAHPLWSESPAESPLTEAAP